MKQIHDLQQDPTYDDDNDHDNNNNDDDDDNNDDDDHGAAGNIRHASASKSWRWTNYLREPAVNWPF